MKTLQRGGWAVAAAASAAALALPAQTQTQTSTGSVTLYGVVDMAMESARTGHGSLQRVESGVVAGSRWGLRGTEDLGGGQRAIYVAEAGFNGDTGLSGQARASSDASAASLRYDHSLSKRTRLYAGVSRIDNDAAAAFTINTASNAGPVVAAGSKPSSVLVGISHAF